MTAIIIAAVVALALVLIAAIAYKACKKKKGERPKHKDCLLFFFSILLSDFELMLLSKVKQTSIPSAPKSVPNNSKRCEAQSHSVMMMTRGAKFIF